MRDTCRESGRRGSNGRTGLSGVATALFVAMVVAGAAVGSVAGSGAAGDASAASTHFDVTIDGTNSPVIEGETLTVDATVEHIGEVSDTQEVTLTVGDVQRDTVEVSLDPGESQSVTFEWATADGDAGGYTAVVSSDGDSDETSVSVRQKPVFDVTIDGTNSPVIEGETLTVDATIDHVGEVSDTQEVTLSVGGTQRDSTELTLEPGESRSVTLEWATRAGDAGFYDATVASDTDSAGTDVAVEEGGQFAVTVDGTNSPVVEGETLTVDTTVENTGETTDTQEVTLSIGGSRRDSTELTLEPGETRSITLEWATAEGDAGGYTATVESEADSDATDVVIEEASGFTVDIDWVVEPVEEGESVVTQATVENTDAERDTRTVELRIDDETVDSTEVTLDSGGSTEVTLGWDTEAGDAGDHTLTVASPNDAESRNVRVNRGNRTQTATVTPTPVPGSTATPVPTTAPAETPTATPTVTATPVPTTTRTPTAAPTATPVPTATDVPTTRSPDATPTPTVTATPVPTTAPTDDGFDLSPAAAAVPVVLFLLLLLLAALAIAAYVYVRYRSERSG
ncbi:hypothetical protein BRC74_06170 [Halobacteriales archaeon QH_7_68_42]|nr:MAG: hypothetical protein BRC74_06170 [Halobacteriales archaeon QH_7_68_42]